MAATLKALPGFRIAGFRIGEVLGTLYFVQGGGGGNPSRQVNPSRRAVSCGVAPPLVNDT
jgi:hypothetical protein